MNDDALPRIVSADTQRAERIPPGQSLTRKWPVLHFGRVPQVDFEKWTFQVTGLVAEPKRWNWEGFRALAPTQVRADMHCVTQWTKLDMEWVGVTVREVMRHVQILPAAAFVLVRAEHGWTTNLPLADFLDDDTLFAWEANGEALSADHGGPLRLVVPKLYAWKSAKWVRGVEFMTADRPGFWEEGGYHMRGDPWNEERFQ